MKFLSRYFGLPCTDACVKLECENYVFRDNDIESDYLSYISSSKYIKHFLLLYCTLCFNFSFYSQHFSFVLLPPKKEEKLENISYSTGDRQSLLV